MYPRIRSQTKPSRRAASRSAIDPNTAACLFDPFIKPSGSLKGCMLRPFLAAARGAFIAYDTLAQKVHFGANQLNLFDF